jgi:ESCRT-I complex subunit VPS28
MDDLANLYSVIRTVDTLERAFTNGTVQTDEYEKNINQLMTQFNVIKTALKDEYPDIEVFIDEYDMDVAFAKARLFGTQVAATRIYHGSDSSKPEVVHILEAGQNFVTLVDSLKLDLVHVDDILPLLRELSDSLSAIPSISANSEVKQTVASWLAKLGQMKASDKLESDETRQMSLDLDTAYSSFHKAVSKISTP